jgi:hypothetical protein
VNDLHDFLTKPRVFVRVYRLPGKLTDGYCFGGGVPITFTNVDWFEAVVESGTEDLRGFIRGKAYYDPTARFFVLGDHPDFVFVMGPDVSTGSRAQ